MIVNFSIENWMSFRDKASLSMIASRERQHSDRVPRIDKYKSRILPIAAIYGGNASGKTNLFKALDFAQEFIINGTQPDSLILVDPYRLDSQGTRQPVSFEFELLIDESIYEFSFSVTREEVLSEKLARVSNTSERILYERKLDRIDFDKTLNSDLFLQYAFKGTRKNQLFLTNSVSQNVETFKPVYNWFKDSLEMIAPDSRFAPFEQFLDENSPLYSMVNTLLSHLDIGIAHLGGEEVPFERIPIPAVIRKKIQEEVKEGMTIRWGESENERFVITRKSGELTAEKLIMYHPKSDGSEAKFEINQESDGSQRIIDLLPGFLDLARPDSRKVYVIDEMDRSLHTLLTRWLVEEYLASCSTETRAQLLFTTHDVLLMDQELLRRDEMWVTERCADGSSSLISFSDYKDIRSDKDIRKSYLQGRMGGIPRILITEALEYPSGKNGQEEKG